MSFYEKFGDFEWWCYTKTDEILNISHLSFTFTQKSPVCLELFKLLPDAISCSAQIWPQLFSRRPSELVRRIPEGTVFS